LQTEQTETTVSVTIRLHYFDEKQGEWMFHDGVCGVPLKRDAVTEIEKATFEQLMFKIGQISDVIERAKLQTEYYQLKKSRPVKDDAIQGAFQIAKSFAIRDAADHLGKLFGSSFSGIVQTIVEPLVSSLYPSWNTLLTWSMALPTCCNLLPP
jgi:hypothetical protein